MDGLLVYRCGCDRRRRLEELRSLVVRVAGYSTYFTGLDKDLQDEIVRRTEFQ